MSFILALIALVLVIIDGALHGFSIILLAIGLVALAILAAEYGVIGNFTRRAP